MSRAARWIAALAGLVAACGPGILTPSLHVPGEAPRLRPVVNELKVHMKSGELYVLESWSLSADAHMLEGSGTRYSTERDPGGHGTYSLPVDTVALLETNDRQVARSFGAVGLGALTTLFGTLSIVCAADPKSCFGSCPTFYLDDDPERPRAEGFSTSIARVLEARDVDALPEARPLGKRLALWMRNEALETHAVRRVRLLAVPRPAGARVFASDDGRFHLASRLVAPRSCRDLDGNCLDALSRDDALEQSSITDPDDLAEREELELTFQRPTAPAGLVISARQSLLSTFLFYQTLAYMGRSAGEWLAQVERGTPDAARRLMGMDRLLGGIDIAVASDEGWRTVGAFHEAGPIAGDVRVIPIELVSAGDALRVRLRFAKGHWRIGWVALAVLGPAVDPHPIELDSVERDGRADDRALALLREGRSHLFTQPGDAYRLTFQVPDAPAELFLESEGYYYEWMRREWLAEEDQAMAALVVTRPDEALRRLAAPFKAREASAEQAFWQSRFRR